MFFVILSGREKAFFQTQTPFDLNAMTRKTRKQDRFTCPRTIDEARQYCLYSVIMAPLPCLSRFGHPIAQPSPAGGSEEREDLPETAIFNRVFFARFCPS